VVSKPVALYLDADCINAAVPFALLLGFLDLKVARFSVVFDGPIFRKTWLVESKIPNGWRNGWFYNFRAVQTDGITFYTHILVQGWHIVDSKLSREFYLESRLGP
jgi:hypothetical protein